MSGPSKISLAIALALIGGNAFALGLGSIQVKSGLNQPLDAEIAVTTDSPSEASGLNVGLASAEDFERVGLSRARVTVPIDFSVITGSNGKPVIKLTTKDVVREPFLDFLVEVNWPKGKLLREYTVLLDPPVAPAVRGAPATVAPAKESAAAAPQRLAEEKPTKSKATQVKPPKSAKTEPKQPPAAKAPAAPSAPAKTAAGGDYGPVAEGETLSEVARATRPDEATNINQMMLALLKANPNAFYKDNINALKRGAILRIPSNDELKATGSAAAAAAVVREQNETWSSGTASKPTLVANAGAPSKSAATPTPSTTSTTKAGTPKAGEHLALVPPRAGKESQASADRPGASTGTSTGADSKAELSRTKEALASREQEASELKSRVKQLEDLNTKDQRLLTLKDSEIAELQTKLKELQSKTGSAATTAAPTTPAKPAETAATTPAKPAGTTKPGETAKPADNKLTAQDIWGNIAASEKSNKPSTTTPATPSATTTSASTPPSATTTAPPTSASASSTTTPAATTPSPSAPPPASTTPSGTTTVTPVTSPTTSAPTSLSTPATPSTTAATPPAKPTVTPTASKPVAPSVPPEAPWYQNSTILIAAGGAVLLIIGLLLLLRFMRKPKPVLAPVGPGFEAEEAMPLTGEEEHHLLDALAQSPGDPHLSLELLRLYYAQRDAGKFEAAAEAMYAHIADPSQPEWQEVKAMGSDLVPHNPLFSSADGFGGEHEEQSVFGHYDEAAQGHADEFDLGGHETKVAAAEDNFDFDLTDHSATTTAPVEDLSFDQEPLPSARPVPAPAPAPVAAPAPKAAPKPAPAPAPAPTVTAPKPADDFFAGEDAIGTKLDLAKAYLDMGDPEGARSMLDEVMAEGNDSQKGEARKLLAEIR